ncbi:MAG: response regulator transcription factor, partial [Methylococcales bacterium]
NNSSLTPEKHTMFMQSGLKIWSTNALNILLVDDHTLFREALHHVLCQLDAQVVILEAANAEEAAQLISRPRILDLILLDIDLPGVDGLTALPSLRELSPTVPIVVLSGSETSGYVKRALDNGAVGYIPKSCSSHEMLGALRIVLQGDVYIPPRLLGKLGGSALALAASCDDHSSQTLLTPRQIEVLELMSRGLPNKSIARTLDVAEGTVKLHVATILRLLNVHNRTEAVMAATQLGLIIAKNQNH